MRIVETRGRRGDGGVVTVILYCAFHLGMVMWVGSIFRQMLDAVRLPEAAKMAAFLSLAPYMENVLWTWLVGAVLGGAMVYVTRGPRIFEVQQEANGGTADKPIPTV